MKSAWVGTALCTICFCLQAGAQMTSMPSEGGTSTRLSMSNAGAQNPFLGGVPSGEATPGVLQLTMKEAIDRGLKYNLGLLLSEQGTREARGAKIRALSDLLPKLTFQTSESRETLNLQAFGFPSFPGIPTVVGPFNVFDTRAFLTQPILDLKAYRSTKAESENIKAAEYSYKDARDVVVLVCAYLYFGAVAESSRVDASTAELKTAQAIFDQATDLKKAGVVPGVDVLRAQVELQARQQRLLFVQNEYQRRKLDLARAIGLPTGQEFALADIMPLTPEPSMTLDQALDRALRSRADYQSAVALVQAAESNKRAAQGEALPSLRFNADYGDIGLAPNQSRGTYTVGASVRIPIFQGGLVRGKVLQADAQLQRRKEELENLRSRIDYEVRTGYMDVKSTGEQVQVAKSAVDLAREQVKESQDRFTAGVANSLEVVQTQEALATADENYISSLYSHNVAKASLAKAVGMAEEAAKQFLGGRP